MRMLVLGAALLTVLMVTVLLLVPAAKAYELPHDPYPWCARYGDGMNGASNCGFRTYAQCLATVSGVGGFCERNQFYNPGTSRHRHHRHYRR